MEKPTIKTKTANQVAVGIVIRLVIIAAVIIVACLILQTWGQYCYTKGFNDGAKAAIYGIELND